jgi:hypothetical protein
VSDGLILHEVGTDHDTVGISKHHYGGRHHGHRLAREGHHNGCRQQMIRERDVEPGWLGIELGTGAIIFDAKMRDIDISCDGEIWFHLAGPKCPDCLSAFTGISSLRAERRAALAGSAGFRLAKPEANQHRTSGRLLRQTESAFPVWVFVASGFYRHLATREGPRATLNTSRHQSLKSLVREIGATEPEPFAPEPVPISDYSVSFHNDGLRIISVNFSALRFRQIDFDRQDMPKRALLGRAARNFDELMSVIVGHFADQMLPVLIDGFLEQDGRHVGSSQLPNVFKTDVNCVSSSDQPVGSKYIRREPCAFGKLQGFRSNRSLLFDFGECPSAHNHVSNSRQRDDSLPTGRGGLAFRFANIAFGIVLVWCGWRMTALMFRDFRRGDPFGFLLGCFWIVAIAFVLQFALGAVLFSDATLFAKEVFLAGAGWFLEAQVWC